MNISKKYYGLLVSLIISVIMSVIMSFAMLVINVGLVPQFVTMWLSSAVIGFIVATPTAMVAFPMTRRFVDWLTSSDTTAQTEGNL